MAAGSTRTIAYVDGFNLFGGSLKRAPPGYRWLDLDAMVRAVLRPNHELVALHYFTALIRPDADDDPSPDRQKLYIKALEHYLPHLTTHYGHFTVHRARARPVDPSKGDLIEYWKVEEKGSDVNLSARLVADAFQNRYDCAVLVTNDGDMAEAVRIATGEAGKTVGAIVPIYHPSADRRPRRVSGELRRNVHFIRELRLATIRRAQLPSPIPGTRLYKPPHW